MRNGPPGTAYPDLSLLLLPGNTEFEASLRFNRQATGLLPRPQPSSDFLLRLPPLHQGFRRQEGLPVELRVVPDLFQQGHRPVALSIRHVNLRQPGLLIGPHPGPLHRFEFLEAFGEQFDRRLVPSRPDQ